jgi:PTS system galactitol-specific IIC component
MQFIQSILNLGATIMMPIVLFILALLSANCWKSLRHAVMVGVAFVGINAVLSAVLGTIGPAIQSLGTAMGIKALGTDIGWAWLQQLPGHLVGLLDFPIGFVINWILLLFGWTKTFDAISGTTGTGLSQPRSPSS